MTPDLIPAVDAAGLPGPIWLFQFLLVFTFFLHIIFMNLTLGGSLLAAIAHTLGGGRADDHRTALASRLVGVNGYAISMTITTGVAPLLFIQVLYHQFFYTATLLIGSMWLGLLLFLTIAYYAVYIYKFRCAPKGGAGGGFWLWISALLFMVIAAIQVAVHLIHAQPKIWTAIVANPWSILGDPSFVPRYLHFLLAGMTFSAVVMTWWAVRQARKGVDVELNTKIAGFAWKWVMWTIAAEVVDGFVLLFVLPKPVLLGLMRGGALTMVPFTLAIILGIGLLMMAAKTSDPVAKPALVNGVFASLLATMALMLVTRDQLRTLYLDGVADLSKFEVIPQWGTFILFAITLVAGLATVYYMIHRVLTSPATGEDAA